MSDAKLDAHLLALLQKALPGEGRTLFAEVFIREHILDLDTARLVTREDLAAMSLPRGLDG